MVTVSCSGKFHAFALAEQLNRHQLLKAFFTTYAYQKNTLFRRAAKRVDKENIPARLIHTNIPIAVGMKLIHDEYRWNDAFDKWVASNKVRGSSLFIGWSGMSLHSIRAAKKRNITTIVERGSSHILYQNEILKDEYASFGKTFSIDQRTIDKEMLEYEEADYISIPSSFVRRTFLLHGVSEKKLVQNPYGAGNLFRPAASGSRQKFTILYLGTLSVQKGLVYLFEALSKLSIPEALYEVHFIGNIQSEIKELLPKFERNNWKFFGHVPFYDLPEHLKNCDIAVQPSLQEGLSMVIPQLMACGIPVIASTNTGGEDIIQDGVSGFVIPVRNAAAITEKIETLFNDSSLLERMGAQAAFDTAKSYTWDAYGERYVSFIKGILQASL